MQIFRVIVRGRFGDLDAETRAELVAAAPKHDIVLGHLTFNSEGSLAYDERVDFFSYRIEARVPDTAGEDPTTIRERALDDAIRTASEDLERRGLPHRGLRATGSNMGDVWR